MKSIFPTSTMNHNNNVTHPLRRAAPPARPHPIAGYRAQHHQYSQKHIQASGIDHPTQLHLQRALHRSQSFSRLPDPLLRNILLFVPPDHLPNVARVSKRLRNIAFDHGLWITKLNWLRYKGPLLLSTSTNSGKLGDKNVPTGVPHAVNPSSGTLDADPPRETTTQEMLGSPFHPPSSTQQHDLLSFEPERNSKHDILSLRNPYHPPLLPSSSTANARVLTYKNAPTSYRERFMYYYRHLLPYLDSLVEHSTDCLVFTAPGLSPLQRAELLATLGRLLHNPYLAPSRHFRNRTIAHHLQQASHAFEASLSRQFEAANHAHNESAMKDLAHIRYALADGRNGPHPTIVHSFIKNRRIFQDPLPFNPLDNLRKTEDPEGQVVEGVDFGGLQECFRHLHATIIHEGTAIGRIFPPEMCVLQYFIEQLVQRVVSGYIARLLSAVQTLPPPLFLITSVEVYSQLRGLIPVVMAVEPRSPKITDETVETIIHDVFVPHLGVYLHEEIAWVKGALQQICSAWNEGVAGQHQEGGGGKSGVETSWKEPSMMKQKMLQSFKTALLLPVTVVPKTVSYSFNALSNVGAGAFHSVASGLITPSASSGLFPGPHSTDYRNANILPDQLGKQAELVSWLDDAPDEPPLPSSSSSQLNPPPLHALPPSRDHHQSPSSSSEDDNDHHHSHEAESHPTHLRALLSLDVALQIITADRQALTRLQSFLPFHHPYRQQVIDTVEEVFVLLLHSLGRDHIQPAFDKAFQRMTNDREEREGDEGGEFFLDFFGLVDVGDTMSQMVTVYSEQTLSGLLDLGDFVSVAGREKRGFERRLDELVARGLGLAIDRLVALLDRLLLRLQRPADFLLPSSLAPAQPSDACLALVNTLLRYCHRLATRTTDRHLLDVFYHEIGLRLHGLLCKHIKRSKISTEGARQVWVDIEHYEAVVVGRILGAQRGRESGAVGVEAGFRAVREAATVYGFVAPKDLARFVHLLVGPAAARLAPLSPDDLYQFVAARNDWNHIHALVHREVYGIGLDHCLIS